MKKAVQTRQHSHSQTTAGAVAYPRVYNTMVFRGKEGLMFKIIDEKLRLASCSISDLTMDQVHDFLGKWEEGAKIGTLTLFYDEDRNMVVLNEDHANYDLYLETVPVFMSLGEETRKEFLDKVPDSEKETFKMLDSAVKRMEYRKDLDKLRHHDIPVKYTGWIDYICRKEKEERWRLMYVFLYGQMCGKREERARRKAAVHN